MRVVDAGRPGAETASRTLGQTLTLLRPATPDLVDAAFLLVGGMIALLGLFDTFSSGRYLAVGFLGLLLGIVVSHVVVVLKASGWWVIPAVLGVHYLLGGAIALREDVLAGFVPSIATWAGLTVLPVYGWKAMLTTVPPVSGDGEYLVLVWVLALAAGAGGHLLARRFRTTWAPVVVPVLLTCTVILIGTFDGSLPHVVGWGITATAFGWLVVRHLRSRRLHSTGMGSLVRWAGGAALIAVALAGGTGLAALMPGPHQTPRLVLRTYVQPPIDIQQFASPLAGFRKYSSDSQRLYDEPLLKVEGAAQGTLVRMAVLDAYDGTVWSAAGGVEGDPSAGFRRVGSTIPGAPTQLPTNTTRVTILPAYAATSDLNVWLPAPGPATEITFAGENEREHRANIRYNTGTGQGLVPDRLKAGDVVEVTSVALPDADGQPAPLGPVLVDSTVSEFIDPATASLGAQDGDPWSRAKEIARRLRTDGSWSNGTLSGEQQYLPGHGAGRLLRFGTEIVGSDEHYAAAYALMLGRLGYPARVVLGAAVGPDETIHGRDVKAWVEVSVAGSGWVTIPTEEFVPDRDKRPTTIPPRSLEQRNAVNVPPPAPARPPGSFDSLFNTGAPGSKLERDPLAFDWWGLALGIGRIVGPPLAVIAAIVGLLLGAKALRRRLRRTRGADTTKVGNGWQEFLDRARDLGHAVPSHATRVEQAAAIGGAEATDLAVTADRIVFGPGEPGTEGAEAYWDDVMTHRAAVVAGLPWWRRWAVALNPRSLVPLARDRRSAAVRPPGRTS